MLALVEEHPDRQAYLQRADRPTVDLLPSEHPETPEVELTPMVLLTGDLRVNGTVDPIPGADTTVWWLSVDDEVRLPPVEVTEPLALDVALRTVEHGEGLHTVDVLVGRGGTTGEAATHPGTAASLLRPRR